MLTVRNVVKVFNRGTINAKKALDQVSLELLADDFVTVIGSNGAGKSTFLNAVAGNLPVDSGEILIDGKEIMRLPAHKRADFISRVF